MTKRLEVGFFRPLQEKKGTEMVVYVPIGSQDSKDA